jgi:phage terminase large subunit-like protein
VLYETGKVQHVGEFPELEEQLVHWTGAPVQKSSDRFDAAMHALRELMGYTIGPRDEFGGVYR